MDTLSKIYCDCCIWLDRHRGGYMYCPYCRDDVVENEICHYAILDFYHSIYYRSCKVCKGKYKMSYSLEKIIRIEPWYDESEFSQMIINTTQTEVVDKN